MGKIFGYLMATLAGVALGLTADWVPPLPPPLSGLRSWEAQAVLGGLSGFAFAFFLHSLALWLERQVAKENGVRLLVQGLAMGLVGALLGGLLAWAVELLFPSGPIWRALQGMVVVALGFSGFLVGYRATNLWEQVRGVGEAPVQQPPIKLLDTSVIIDGRIGDLAKTGVIEGKILIPQFILSELHAIADSADNLRRRKGRRGLDILGELRRNPDLNVETIDKDYAGLTDVDRKLIQLAKELNAKIITTDYNLNKVAKVEGVAVLNINEVANAVKPKFIPGEELEVEVIDKGEEIGQGIGYLDDGTMVVVENGRRFIGRKIRAVVHSSLQTEAGKMLFVRPKVEVPKEKWEAS
ncbi:MAG: PIN domain-containing protein [Candidatus Bipolaricaulota bacterium]|nr:PIN domain-containing protein [Candidatus Bipolaricaulota bacterium]MDW8329835.1 PIN domain-containing protein [Candidatus Bipolaricaulota bacterium]